MRTDDDMLAPMRATPSTQDVVLACINGTAGAPALATGLHERHVADAMPAARDHQVTTYLHQALRRGAAAGAGTLLARLQAAAATTAVAQLEALADLHWVAHALAAAGVPWLLIKGPVLSERVYPDPALRPSRDLDLVVPARRFGSALAALDAGGATLLDANWELAIAQRRGQVHVQLPHGTTMDLHWHLVNAGPVRDTLAIAMPSVWRDRRTVTVHGLAVETLSTTDTVVHLGVHAALGGAWRLRWLNDLKLVIAHEPVDWHAVVERARQWRARHLLAIALMRSQRLLHADVPGHVLADLLATPGARALVRTVDRVWSPVAATHALAPARLWPQFVRDTWADALRAAAWRVRRRAGNGLRGFWHDRERPEAMDPSGGDDGRGRYLGLVERGDLDRARRAA